MAEQHRDIGTDHIARALELVPSSGADDELIRQGAAQLLGRPIIAMRSLGGGSTSATFAVTTSAGEFVIKVNRDAAVITRAARNLDVLAGLGLPVPTVVDYSPACGPGGFAMLATTKLPGRDLGFELPTMTQTQMTRVAEQITQLQAKVATLPSGGGCGFVGIGEIPSRTWPDVVRHPTIKAPLEKWPADAIDLVPRLYGLIDVVEP